MKRVFVALLTLAASTMPCAADSQTWAATIQRHQAAYNACVATGFQGRECRIESEIMRQALQRYNEEVMLENYAARQRLIIEQNRAILQQIEEARADQRRRQERTPYHVYSPSTGSYVPCWGEVDCRHQAR